MTTATQAPSAPVSNETGPKGTAANIANAIQTKADPQKGDAKGSNDPKSAPNADPNVGREQYKVNGKEIWLTPEQARAYVQKGLAFEPRMSELAKIQKEMKEFGDTFKNDPIKIYQKMGLSPNEILKKVINDIDVSDETKELFGKWYYNNVVKRSQMTPEQIELEDHRKWRAEHEQKEKMTAEESAAKENAFKVQQALGELKGKIGEAMKEFNLPSLDSPVGAEIARRIAQVMKNSYFNRQPCTPKDAATKVREELKIYNSMFLDSLDDDKLIEAIGEKNAEKIKKHFLKLVKNENKPTVERTPSTRKDERKVTNLDQFHEYLDGLKRSGK